jgi:hypothetical protein
MLRRGYAEVGFAAQALSGRLRSYAEQRGNNATQEQMVVRSYAATQSSLRRATTIGE